MNAAFEWSRALEFYETDLAGIAHFSNFYRWMESAEHAYLRSRGIALHSGGIGWPRVSATADFKRPIKFGDVVRVSVVVDEIRTRSVRYRFEFRVNEEEAVRARGEMTSVCVALSTMKAVEIPSEIREKLT